MQQSSFPQEKSIGEVRYGRYRAALPGSLPFTQQPIEWVSFSERRITNDHGGHASLYMIVLETREGPYLTVAHDPADERFYWCALRNVDMEVPLSEENILVLLGALPRLSDGPMANTRPTAE